MEHWEQQAKKAKEKKELQAKYPLLGKRVRRKGRGNKWEEGIVVLDTFDDGTEEELFIQFAENDLEQLDGLPFQIWNESSQTWNEG